MSILNRIKAALVGLSYWVACRLGKHDYGPSEVFYFPSTTVGKQRCKHCPAVLTLQW